MAGFLECIPEDFGEVHSGNQTSGGVQIVLGNALSTCNKLQFSKKMMTTRHQKMLRHRHLALQQKQDVAGHLWAMNAPIAHQEMLASFPVMQKELSKNWLAGLGHMPEDSQQSQDHDARHRGNTSADSVSLEGSAQHSGEQKPEISSSTLTAKVELDVRSREDSGPESKQSLCDFKAMGGLRRVPNLPGSLRLPCPSPSSRSLRLWESLRRQKVSSRVSPQSVPKETCQDDALSWNAAADDVMFAGSRKLVPVDAARASPKAAFRLDETEMAIDID